jgi:hypothetical protein
LKRCPSWSGHAGRYEYLYSEGECPKAFLNAREKLDASVKPQCIPTADTGRVCRSGSTRSARHFSNRWRRSIKAIGLGEGLGAEFFTWLFGDGTGHVGSPLK